MLGCAGATICCLNDVKDLRVLNIVVAAKSFLGSLGPLLFSFLFSFLIFLIFFNVYYFFSFLGVREETLSCENCHYDCTL